MVANSGLLSTDIEGIGVSGTGFPLFFAVSLFLTVVFIRYHKKFFNKNSMAPEERTRDNRRNTQGNIAPVYILMGEEAYFIDLIVENLEAFAVDEADK